MTTPIAADVDPVTYEVIRHRLAAIAAQQSAVLKSVSGSPIVTDANDCNTGIYLADGTMLSVGPHVVFHAGSMSQVVPHIIADCSANPGIHEGDAFITNDPYKGALHLPDVTVLEPVFHEGERIAWVGACAHQLDIGGIHPSSWCPDAVDCRQEGLVLPPTKLVDGGTVREDVWRLILAASRLPFMLGLDLKAMLATNRQGRTGLLNLVERYGVDTVRAVMAMTLDRSERTLRERLAALPDGEFRARNFLDHDGHRNKLYTVDVVLRKEGDGITLDFSGTSPQADGFVNCTASGLFGAVFSGFAPILAHDIPWNAGLLRPVDVIAPSGLLVNAEHPAPCSSATLGAAWVAEAAVVEAFSKLAACGGPRFSGDAKAATTGSMALMHIGGLNQYGEPFGNAATDAMMGGGGATAAHAGVDFAGPHNIFKYAVPNVENTEKVSPLLYLSHTISADSGGPGRRRGGLSGAAAFVVHDAPFMGAVLCTHGVEVPNGTGLAGGYPGSTHDITLLRDTDVRARLGAQRPVLGAGDVSGAGERLSAKPGELEFTPDDVFDWSWQGGGGYGDPLAASPSDVAADVAQGYVSREAARSAYGVVLDEHGEADEDATRAMRDGMRSRRRQWPVPSPGDPGTPAAPVRERLQIGDSLRLVTDGTSDFWACACGRVLSPGGENWKAAMATRTSTSGVLPTIRLHEDLELREYACPGCGVLHGVEVALAQEDGVFDARLA